MVDASLGQAKPKVWATLVTNPSYVAGEHYCSFGFTPVKAISLSAVTPKNANWAGVSRGWCARREGEMKRAMPLACVSQPLGSACIRVMLMRLLHSKRGRGMACQHDGVGIGAAGLVFHWDFEGTWHDSLTHVHARAARRL